jgi:hypothetical protein
MRTRLSALIILILTTAVLAATPSAAEAQRRRAGRVLRSRPIVVGVYGLGRIGPWYPHVRGYYPYGYASYGYPPYGYPGYGYYPVDRSASVRIQVVPREAEVYVDGAFAGLVDDFDGIFQRLQVVPGGHEIVLYLDGYRPESQELYLAPASGYTIRHAMVPLGVGETPAPRPTATLAPQAGPSPRFRPAAPIGPTGPRVSGFGTLQLRVQPAGAEVFIDGEAWQGPAGDERLVVQVSAGRHVVEVFREGYPVFSTEVTVRAGETVPLNVSLSALEGR